MHVEMFCMHITSLPGTPLDDLIAILVHGRIGEPRARTPSRHVLTFRQTKLRHRLPHFRTQKRSARISSSSFRLADVRISELSCSLGSNIH
jgi:hypothetical protein